MKFLNMLLQRVLQRPCKHIKGVSRYRARINRAVLQDSNWNRTLKYDVVRYPQP